jgi:hypothetical protein
MAKRYDPNEIPPSQLKFCEEGVPLVIGCAIRNARHGCYSRTPDSPTALFYADPFQSMVKPNSIPLMLFTATILVCAGRGYSKNPLEFVADDKHAWCLQQARPKLSNHPTYDEIMAASKKINLDPALALDPELFFRGGWAKPYRGFMRKLLKGK